MFQQLKDRFFPNRNSDNSALTTREIDYIRLSWSYLRADIAGFKGFGADLFIRFFAKYPDYQRQFKSFKDVPVRFSAVPMQAMAVNKKLLAHGTYVMYTIGMLVDHLEDLPTLELMLKRLARNHYRRRVAITAFELLRETFILQLGDYLGPDIFTAKDALAWRKAFAIILEALEHEFAALEGDVQKRGSYYQLNSTHRAARKSMLRSVTKTAYQQEQEQQTKAKGAYLLPPGYLDRSRPPSPFSPSSGTSSKKQHFRLLMNPFKLLRKSFSQSDSSK